MADKIVNETKLQILNSSTIEEIKEYWKNGKEDFIIEDGKITIINNVGRKEN